MEPHKHPHIYRENDIDRVIARYGRKPPEKLRSKMFSELRGQQDKFRQLESYRSRGEDQARGQSR